MRKPTPSWTWHLGLRSGQILQIWHHDLHSGDWNAIATVTDPDGESSGIADASSWFGPGSWLLTVQGHGVNVIEEIDSQGFLRKLESGQLLLMNVPGS